MRRETPCSIKDRQPWSLAFILCFQAVAIAIIIAP
jgi:hypothetical protein